MINIKINKKPYAVEKQQTVLEICKKLNIYIPTLCYHEDQKPKSNCRLCLVEINNKIESSCDILIEENMNIITNNKKIREYRKTNLELLLSNHNSECTTCGKNQNCEFQKISEIIKPESNFKKDTNFPIENNNYSIIRDINKCIKCCRCVEACDLKILGEQNRSLELKILPYNNKLNNSKCTYCGQCAIVCPTNAISIKKDINIVLDMLEDESIYTIVQVAPAIRTSIGEIFNSKDKIYTKKMVSALKRLNFDKVFDTNFSADLTIIEESIEFYNRLTKNENLPMFTSCCPSWINFAEKYHPEILKNISSCKSPHQMFGALIKEFYKDKNPFVISIMPCTAKKDEIKREQLKSDVDIVLTTVELAEILKQKNIDFNSLEDKDFDLPFGISSGAASIFANTGGVMEAALRTTYEMITNKKLENLEFKEIRGLNTIKETTINIKGKDIKIAVVQTLTAAEEIIKNKNNYHFIEVMSCLGGCIGGGGQPFTTNKNRKNRIENIYQIDKTSPFRKSHTNKELEKFYKTFLKDKKFLLHTKYKDQS